MAKSPEEIREGMIAKLKEKTGKSLEEWLRVVKSSKLANPPKHGEIMKLLKGEHKLGHGDANIIALRAVSGGGSDAPDTGDLLAAQYSGNKAAARPIYDAIVKAAARFGPDVEASPKKTYVSL